jgi:hypothetical protein
MSSSDSSFDSFDEIPTLAEMMTRPSTPSTRPSYAAMVRGFTPPVPDVTSVTKFQEPSGGKKISVDSPKITSLAQKEVAPVAGVSDKKKPATKISVDSLAQKEVAPVAGVSDKKKPATKISVDSPKITSLAQKEVAPVAGVSEKKKPATHHADTKKNPREVDWFSHPSHQLPHKKEKKIREKLGLLKHEMALSQASLTSASTTFSLLQAAVARAKEEIEKRDATIKLLETETSAGILSKYAPPPG